MGQFVGPYRQADAAKPANSCRSCTDCAAALGVAGAGGQAVVANALLQAAESDQAKLKAIEAELVPDQSLSDKLAEAAARDE